MAKEKPKSPAEKKRKIQTPHKEAELLREIKGMLDEIKIAERPGDTAPGRKSALQTKMVAARFPVELVQELEALPGRKSHHLERALMLYLRVMKGKDSYKANAPK